MMGKGFIVEIKVLLKQQPIVQFIESTTVITDLYHSKVNAAFILIFRLLEDHFVLVISVNFV